MYTVYILYSACLDSYYIGSTSDLEGRLHRHLTNHNGYTGRAKDWVIVYTEKFETKVAAQLREKEIKSWKARSRIDRLIGSFGSAHSD